MHIRNDWALLYTPQNKQRVMSLCGVKSTPSNCGTPGITKSNRGDWCNWCIYLISEALCEFYGGDKTGITNGVLYTYHMIAAEVMRCSDTESAERLAHTVGAEIDYILPAWDRYSQSLNNPAYVVWSVMMDRCYDQKDPAYPMWGGLGVNVAPEWHNFHTFADASPEGVTGVFPRAGSKTIGPKTCIWK